MFEAASISSGKSGNWSLGIDDDLAMSGSPAPDRNGVEAMTGRGDLLCASSSRRRVMEAAIDQEPASLLYLFFFPCVSGAIGR